MVSPALLLGGGLAAGGLLGGIGSLIGGRGGGGFSNSDAQAIFSANTPTIVSPFGNIVTGEVRPGTRIGDRIMVAPFEGVNSTAIEIQETPFQRDQRIKQQQIARKLLGKAATLANQVQTGGDPLAPIRGRFTLQDVIGGQDAHLERATFERGLNLLQPIFDNQTRRLEQQLADRGLPPGSEAHDRAVSELRRAQSDALENLALSSVSAARDQAARIFDQTATARQIRGQEELAARQQLLAEIAQLLTGAPTFPTVQPIQGNAGSTAASIGAQTAAARQAAFGGLFGGLLGAGGQIAAAGL